MLEASHLSQINSGRVFEVGIMKVLFQSCEKRAELSAVMMVVTLLAIATFAKFDLAMPLFDLVR